MPAIASIEELDIAQRDFRSMFLVVSPYALRLTIRNAVFGGLWLEESSPEELKGRVIE